MSGPTPLFCTSCKQRRQLAHTDLCALCLEYQQLLNENILDCPAFLTQWDFHAFMHRFAVHAHAQRTPEAKHVTLEQTELNLTEVVLQALPRYYVSMLDFDPEQHERKQTGAKGSYTFKARLPNTVLFKTLEKKELLRPQDPEGNAGV